MALRHLLSWQKVDSKATPTFQGGPEVKYLFQEGMFGNRSFLAKLCSSLETSLGWRTLLGLLYCGHVSCPIVLVWDVRGVAICAETRAWDLDPS